MTTGRYSRRNLPLRQTGARPIPREENFFLVMIGCSVVVHIIAAAIFSHTPPSPIQQRTPPLYVDLVMPPVANPQRGSAGAVRKIAAPVAVEKVPALPTKVAKEEVVVKVKEPKKTDVVKDDGIAEAMAKMKQRKADQDELNDAQAAIANMKKKTIPTQQAVATVGSASGTGDEAGSAVGEWLQSAVKSKWVWAGKKRKELSAEIEVTFDTTGKLSNYRFMRTSGDALFDKSLTNALLKLEALPKELRKPFQETILFNLDDLQGQ